MKQRQEPTTSLKRNNNNEQDNSNKKKQKASSTQNDNITTLEVTKFNQWTREQVCSLLILPKVQGGAHLHGYEVQFLYDSKFDGTSLANIVQDIKKAGTRIALDQLVRIHNKKKTAHLSDICQIVFRWVCNLLKTRLYHLWNDEQVIELLCKPIEKSGAELSVDDAKRFVRRKLLTKLLNILDRTNEENEVMDEFNNLIQEEQITNSNLIECMKNIISNSLLKFELFFKNTKFSPPPFNDLPYLNNKSTIKMMATTLLTNTRLHQSGQNIRNHTLLVNAAYFGSGKTRLGVEFLSQFKLQMIEDPKWKAELENQYSPSLVQQLAESKIVYVDCGKVKIINNNLELTCNNLKDAISEYLNSSIESTPCFVILDGISSLVLTYQPMKIEGIHSHFCSLHAILQEFVLPFQKIKTVSLYVCGKGAFMDIIGENRFYPHLQPPTQVQRILLETLSKDDIHTALNNMDDKESLVNHLKKFELFYYFIEKLYEESRGVPYFVVFTILKSHFLTCQTRDKIDAKMIKTRSELSHAFSHPYDEFYNQPMFMKIYHALLFAGIVGMEIDSTRFDISCLFNLETKGTYFEGIANVNMLDICSMLTCYLHPVGNRFKLIFPQVVIETYLISYIPRETKYDFSWLVNERSTSDTLEHLTRILLKFKMAWGYAQNSKIGEILPFLSKTSVANITCYPLLEIENVQQKEMKKSRSNNKAWKKIVKKLKGTGNLLRYHYKDSPIELLWNVVAGTSACVTETYIQIQDLSDTTTFNLEEEVEKNEKIRKVIGDNEQLIMIFMNGSSSDHYSMVAAGTYVGGCTIVDGIQLHKNTTVVILSKEEAIQFYGNSSTMEALKRLSVSHK